MQVLARRLRDCWDSERFRGWCGGTWLIARLMCCWIGLDGRRRDGMDEDEMAWTRRLKVWTRELFLVPIILFPSMDLLVICCRYTSRRVTSAMADRRVCW
jgi:hypothetical protein